MEPKLYVIATPIGNVEDITLRAIRLLKELDLFFVEDTREFTQLLQHLGITREGKTVLSYAKHNLREGTQKAVGFLKTGRSIGLLSDRGTPGISDPGAKLVAAARESGVTVVPVPGVSSVTAALSSSGLDADRFVFLGFVPHEAKDQKVFFEDIKNGTTTKCFFESPKRIRATVEELKAQIPSRKIILFRELTKKFESAYESRLAEINAESLPELGEYVVVVEGNLDVIDEKQQASGLEDAMRLRLASDKEWAKQIAKQLDLASSDIYNALQAEKRKERTI